MGFGVWGLGFGVWGLGFGVWGLGFGVWGLGFGVWDSAPDDCDICICLNCVADNSGTAG